MSETAWLIEREDISGVCLSTTIYWVPFTDISAWRFKTKEEAESAISAYLPLIKAVAREHKWMDVPLATNVAREDGTIMGVLVPEELEGPGQEHYAEAHARLLAAEADFLHATGWHPLRPDIPLGTIRWTKPGWKTSFSQEIAIAAERECRNKVSGG